MLPNSLTSESSPRLRIATLIRRALAEQSGATAIEYALIAGSISIVIVVAVTTLGTTLTATFQTIASMFLLELSGSLSRPPAAPSFPTHPPTVAAPNPA